MTTNAAARAWLGREYRRQRRAGAALIEAIRLLLRVGEREACSRLAERLSVVCLRCDALRRAIAALDQSEGAPVVGEHGRPQLVAGTSLTKH